MFTPTSGTFFVTKSKSSIMNCVSCTIYKKDLDTFEDFRKFIDEGQYRCSVA